MSFAAIRSMAELVAEVQVCVREECVFKLLTKK